MGGTQEIAEPAHVVKIYKMRRTVCRSVLKLNDFLSNDTQFVWRSSNVPFANYARCFLKLRTRTAATESQFHQTARFQNVHQRSKPGNEIKHAVKRTDRFDRIEFLVHL